MFHIWNRTQYTGPPYTSVNIDGPPHDSPNLLGKRGGGVIQYILMSFPSPCKWSLNSNANVFGSDCVPVFDEPQGGGGGVISNNAETGPVPKISHTDSTLTLDERRHRHLC